MRRIVGAAMLAACALLLTACAHTPEAIAENDPLEPMNRAVFDFNKKFDHYVVLPVAGLYVFYLPPPVHRGLDNFLLNLDLPVTFANQVMQGDVDYAGQTLMRFALNTTFGLGGFVDLAGRVNIPYRTADFGQTLGKYGVPEGPFLMVPVIGPAPPRDLLGTGVDIAINPLILLPPGAPDYQHVLVSMGQRAVSPFEEHARNIVLRNELERGSVDPYVTTRSIYRQLRDEKIRGAPPDENIIPTK